MHGAQATRDSFAHTHGRRYYAPAREPRPGHSVRRSPDLHFQATSAPKASSLSPHRPADAVYLRRAESRPGKPGTTARHRRTAGPSSGPPAMQGALLAIERDHFAKRNLVIIRRRADFPTAWPPTATAHAFAHLGDGLLLSAAHQAGPVGLGRAGNLAAESGLQGTRTSADCKNLFQSLS